MEIDLNANRAARAEKSEAVVVKFGFDSQGKPIEWSFRNEIPVDCSELLVEGRLGGALTLLLADPEDVEAFMALSPSAQDLNDILLALTGADSGKSPASGKRSRSTGKR